MLTQRDQRHPPINCSTCSHSTFVLGNTHSCPEMSALVTDRHVCKKWSECLVLINGVPRRFGTVTEDAV